MLETNLSSGTSLTEGAAQSPISYADALENYRKNTDWWIVFDSFDLPGSKGSALWISGRTGIGLDTVSEALEGLIVLGLLARSTKGYEKIKTEINLPRDPSKAKRMAEHCDISRQVLNHVGEASKGAFRFASFASNSAVISEMYAKINQAIFEADEKSKALTRDQIDNIYLTSLTAVTTMEPQAAKGASNV